MSTESCANSVSRSEGSRTGSLGCTARYRTADSMRCSNGENDSSIGRSSVGSLALLAGLLDNQTSSDYPSSFVVTKSMLST